MELTVPAFGQRIIADRDAPFKSRGNVMAESNLKSAPRPREKPPSSFVAGRIVNGTVRHIKKTDHMINKKGTCSNAPFYA